MKTIKWAIAVSFIFSGLTAFGSSVDMKDPKMSGEKECILNNKLNTTIETPSIKADSHITAYNKVVKKRRKGKNVD